MTPEQIIKQAISKGQFVDAIQDAERQLKTLDNSQHKAQIIELLYLKGVAYRLSGNLQNAIDCQKRILSLHASHSRAHQELGYVYRASAKPLESASHFYQATQSNPALLSSWKTLYEHYKSTDNQTALNLAQVQLDYLNALPKPILHARDLMYEGQLHKANQLCRQYLQTDKHHPEGMLLLAEIGIALKVYGEAEFLLESCLTLYPEHKAAGIEYLKLLSKMGRFQAAKDLAEKLDAAHPAHPPIMVAKASAMVGLGEIDAAIELYQALLAKTPEQAGLQLLLGHAFKAAGKLDDAIRAYQTAYKQKPDFGDAYWSLANTKTYVFSDTEIQDMQTQANLDIDEDDKIHFYFALGKSYEDRNAFTESFEYYAKGNALKQAQTGYKPQALETQINKQKQVFISSVFAQLENQGCQRPDPIFVLGLPRAGSTLLEQILASHSQVDGTMELHNILGLAAKLNGPSNRYPEIITSLKPDYFARFGEQYLQETQAYRGNAPRFIDKMPNNFIHIGLIKLILPNAKVIDARREPMACCFSGFKQLFAEGQEFTYGLDNISHYYKHYVELMNHWDEVLPGFVLRVKHEDVIEDLEGQVKRMLDFCGLQFEQACVDFHKTKRTIKTPSSEQVRQPIFKDSMLQWKNYSAPLQEMHDFFVAEGLIK
ncbi:sulfotransferase [Glaciecola sp. XM2]|uniref:tetratricopeptide repeat-containing sulfotransferase family protein n=1 Tax=Glaciecola sp. XM2 TaxID=1914931 RepID=UPI001BDE4D6C|nr:sulfotransferase [Glaciecola sp. XM2]